MRWIILLIVFGHPIPILLLTDMWLLLLTYPIVIVGAVIVAKLLRDADEHGLYY